MTILQLQRRIREAGRIRIGQQVASSNGKKRPEKLETFRLTSPDRQRIEQAAGLFGGRPAEWQAPAGKQWEVVTESDVLEVIVPPSEMSFSQHYELWSGGGCQRRCDGHTEQITDGPCLCDPEERECKPHTRLSVMLRDLPGLGVWRLDTQGYYAAVELVGAVQVIAAAAGAGTLLPARLRLEQRQVKRPGEPTRRFAVPTLDVEVTPAQLLGGQGGGMALGAATSGLELEAPEQERPALMAPVPPTVAERPAAPVAEQAAVVEEPKAAGKRRKNAAQPLPSTGLQPRTAQEASRTAASGPEPSGEGDGPEDVGKLKKAQLQLRLGKAGLETDGTVDELRKRWREHLAGGASGSSTSDEAPPPPDDDEPARDPSTRAPSEDQRAKFFATINDLGIDDDRRRAWIKARFEVDSFTKLDRTQVATLIDALEERPGDTLLEVEGHWRSQRMSAALIALGGRHEDYPALYAKLRDLLDTQKPYEAGAAVWAGADEERFLGLVERVERLAAERDR